MAEEPVLDVAEIQGNVLRGFNTSHQLLLGLKLSRPVTPALKAWLAGLPVTPLGTAAIWRSTRRQARLSGQDVAPPPLLSLALSFDGAQAIGLPVSGIKDQLFSNPMGGAARTLGDRLEGNTPVDYLYGRTWADTPDIMLILAAEDAGTLQQQQDELLAQAAGAQLLFRELGARLPGEAEHFGFRDGISQAAPRGRLSARPDDFLYQRMLPQQDPRTASYAWPGKPLVWPGQYVFGYAGHPHGGTEPAAIVTGGQDWMRNGSYLVYRRLRQDVAGFRDWCAAQAQAMSAAGAGAAVSAAAFAARVVGRWPDGTAFHVAPDGPDLAIAGDIRRINHFQFDRPTADIIVVDEQGARRIPGAPADPDAMVGGRCAHIRKVNPRDLEADKGSADDTLRLQMLRRGIPYGPAFVPDEPPRTDRGLLFLAYQTSIAGQFLKLLHDWMNESGRPERGGEGQDLLVGQDRSAPRFGVFPRPDGTQFTATAPQHFITATGGAFLFAPSISVIRSLQP